MHLPGNMTNTRPNGSLHPGLDTEYATVQPKHQSTTIGGQLISANKYSQICLWQKTHVTQL